MTHFAQKQPPHSIKDCIPSTKWGHKETALARGTKMRKKVSSVSKDVEYLGLSQTVGGNVN